MLFKKYRYQTQRGVVLITVLLVLAIATVIAVSMSTRQQIHVRKSENILRTEQAWSYVYGIENWAISVLQADAKNNDEDHHFDVWAKSINNTKVAGGQLNAKIEDMQAKFNINNLYQDEEVNEIELIRFKRLLVLLGLKQNLANAVLDWIDTDSDTRFPGGAEDTVYTIRQQPYRAANSPITDISELLFVNGFNLEILKKLEPYVTALPDYAPLNINTADLILLKTLADGSTISIAEDLFRSRNEKPISDIYAWIEKSQYAESGFEGEGLTTASKFFKVTGNVQVGELVFSHETLLNRILLQQIKVIQRKKQGVLDG